jgi:hypothetical protein
MLTIIEAIQPYDKVSTCSDGRGIVVFKPRVDHNHPQAPARADYFAHVVPGAIVVKEGKSLGVIHEVYTGLSSDNENQSITARYWPLSKTTQSECLKTHMMLLYGLSPDEVSEVCEITVNNADLSSTPQFGFAQSQLYGQQALRMGCVSCDKETWEKPKLLDIPGLDTPEIDMFSEIHEG